MVGLDIKPLPPAVPVAPLRRVEPRDGTPPRERRKPGGTPTAPSPGEDKSHGIDTYA